jgi:hypothetical protein
MYPTIRTGVSLASQRLPCIFFIAALVHAITDTLPQSRFVLTPTNGHYNLHSPGVSQITTPSRLTRGKLQAVEHCLSQCACSILRIAVSTSAMSL